MNKLKGPLMLLATAALWGFAFVAQTSAAGDIQPFTFNASRNFVGALFLTFVIAFRKKSGSDIAPCDAVRSKTDESSDGAPKSNGSVLNGRYTKRALIIGGTACGLVLCASSFLQQCGISSYPADAGASGRSGFITATYMIMVALFTVFVGKKPHPLVFCSVGVAVVGMYFLCVPNGFGDLYIGDVLVLICAVGYAAHIIVIDRFTNVDGVRLSRVQLIVSGGVSLVMALVFEHPALAMIIAAAIPILYAGILSDGVAYTLQIVAQKTTDPTVASILMSLESVFAGIGGWLILGERLGGIELFGCALVFIAVMLAQVPSFIDHAKEKRAQKAC